MTIKSDLTMGIVRDGDLTYIISKFQRIAFLNIICLTFVVDFMD